MFDEMTFWMETTVPKLFVVSVRKFKITGCILGTLKTQHEKGTIQWSQKHQNATKHPYIDSYDIEYG